MPHPPALRIEQHTGPRAELRGLFALAEDSTEQLDAYLDEGRVLVALDGERIVGHLQLIAGRSAGELEIRNMAVLPSHRRGGVGRALIAAAIALAREEARSRLGVAPPTADVGNLRFYQRSGFRMSALERDAFPEAEGYRDVVIDGIELRDRVWLALDVPGEPPAPPEP